MCLLVRLLVFDDGIKSTCCVNSPSPVFLNFCACLCRTLFHPAGNFVIVRLFLLYMVLSCLLSPLNMLHIASGFKNLLSFS
uniref:Putative secreted protein n=1 Tax=Amblyomma cajennense TaxID=34607 RepID=A0A023FD41_AMBCJ